MAQVEQALRKIIDFHGFNSNEGFSCLIPDKAPYPSNEGLLLWFSSKTRVETKVQLFHSPARIRRMEDMLGIPEREYIKQFTEHLEDYLNSLREIGFEDIGKGVDLFGAGRISNVKADFELFEKNPEMLKKFEDITLNNPIVKFAEDQNYFRCANVNASVFDVAELASTEGSKASKDSGTKRAAAKGKKEKATSSSNSKEKATSSAKKAKKTTKPAAAKVTEKPKEAAAAPKAKTKAKAKKTNKAAPKAKAPVIEETAPAKGKSRTSTKKKSSESTIVDEITERQKLWSKQVENLYKKIQNWAGSQIKNGTLLVHFHPVELADELGRPYKMECLELDTGYSQLVLQPMEMNLLGTVGRIDIYWPDGKLPKITLLLLDVVRNKPFWELWRGTSIDDRQALEKDSFDAMLREWLG